MWGSQENNGSGWKNRTTATVPLLDLEALQAKANTSSSDDKKEEAANDQLLVCKEAIFKAQSGRTYPVLGGRTVELRSNSYDASRAVAPFAIDRYVDIAAVHGWKLGLIEVLGHPVMELADWYLLLNAGYCFFSSRPMWENNPLVRWSGATAFVCLMARQYTARQLQKQLREDCLFDIESTCTDYTENVNLMKAHINYSTMRYVRKDYDVQSVAQLKDDNKGDNSVLLPVLRQHHVRAVRSYLSSIKS